MGISGYLQMNCHTTTLIESVDLKITDRLTKLQHFRIYKI